MSDSVIRILSAGSVEPGLTTAARTFAARHGCRVDLDWATTPNIRRRVGAGECFDLLVLTTEAAAELMRAGKLRPESSASIGSVGVSVAVREGAPVPSAASVEDLTRALARADTLIFTRATSGLYVESLLKREELYAGLLRKIERFETGPQMMDRLIHSEGDVICLGASVELRMFDGRGIRCVAPLPEAWQHRTEYVAARMAAASNADGAAAFARFLCEAEGRGMLAACGVDVPVR